MTRTERFRFLVIGATGLTALMIAGSRWVGRTTHPAGGEGEPAAARRGADLQAPSRAAAADGALDLSFYRELGRPSLGAPQPEARGERVAPDDQDASPEGAYVVQALATKDPAQAGRLRDRLAGKGLPATIVEGRAGEVTVYRVRVGRYRDRVVAEALARRLRTEDGVNPWVLRESE